ncbi:MAG: LysR family transcriptional regulator [Rudaea sp.]|uniref:LysR family transcriptional regulator n=1 Tax=unclassified Rudaea TaxID=2627037 RepID=UPI0010F9C6AE|nr:MULTISPECIES: LysR family transcriptional regulator [unclassified Rudaea]MBN8888303.1 LysR family transcriptional regulator [Rudaea sp.]MBR0346725.1 LysR family transcriptional regulator [Rudaea sp.]
MDFDPALLRTFVAVKEAGGFTRAAERLYLTQSAVSHQIRRLEEHVGRPLLHRTTRKLNLTQDGEDLLRYAKQALQSLDTLNARFRPSPIAGVLRVGVPENFMGSQFPKLLCQFARTFPGVRLEVCAGISLDLREMLAGGELDLAIVLGVPAGKDGVVVRRTQFVWAAAEYFELPANGSLPLAFAPSSCICRQVGLDALDGTPIDWHIAFTSQSVRDLLAAVHGGFGVAVLTRDNLEPGMKVIGDGYGLPALPSADFLLIRGKTDATPAADAFARLVLEMAEPEQAEPVERKRKRAA